jgi:hypothetical protein
LNNRNVAAEEVTFLFRIEEVSASNLGPLTWYPECGDWFFPHSAQINAGVTSQLRPNRFLAHYLHLIKHSAIQSYMEHDIGH